MSMFAVLSSVLRSRKLLPRLVFGAIGAISALAIIKAVDAHAQPLSGGVDTILSQASLPLFEVLRDDFPAEYAAFSDQLKLVIKTDGDVAQATFASLMKIRLDYAPYLAQADDASLADLAAINIEIYRAVIELEGLEVCAQFATTGMAALAGTEFQALHQPLVLEQVAAMLHAGRSGFDNPVNRPAASDADWQAVSGHSLELGADMASFTAMANGEPVSGVCPSMIAFFQAASDGQVAGELVRAELLAMIAAEA
jgi:hypothetical protein